MLFLNIIDKSGAVKFSAKGACIEAQYCGSLETGDKLQIHLDGTNVLAVQLDQTLQESYLYCPSKSFTFTIPTARELQMGYNPQAFQGDTHLICAREVEDEEFYKSRNIALNSHD